MRRAEAGPSTSTSHSAGRCALRARVPAVPKGVRQRLIEPAGAAEALTDGPSRTKHAEKFKYNAKAEPGEEMLPPHALSGGSYEF